MHDLGLPICCCQNHIQKKHPVRGVLSFALTPRSGGLGVHSTVLLILLVTSSTEASTVPVLLVHMNVCVHTTFM